LNTFSEDEKNTQGKMVHKIIGTANVQTVNINDILKNHGFVENGLD